MEAEYIIVFLSEKGPLNLSNILLVEIFIGGAIITIQGLKLILFKKVIFSPIPSANKLVEKKQAGQSAPIFFRIVIFSH